MATVVAHADLRRAHAALDELASALGLEPEQARQGSYVGFPFGESEQEAWRREALFMVSLTPTFAGLVWGDAADADNTAPLPVSEIAAD